MSHGCINLRSQPKRIRLTVLKNKSGSGRAHRFGDLNFGRAIPLRGGLYYILFLLCQGYNPQLNGAYPDAGVREIPPK